MEPAMNQIILKNEMITMVCPNEGQEIYQKLTIREDGSISFSSRLWCNESGSIKGVPGRRIRCKMDSYDAAKLIKSLFDYFRNQQIFASITDIPTWSITVLSDGETVTVDGGDGEDVFLTALSRYIRTMLPFKGAALFEIPDDNEENKEPYPGDILYHSEYGRGVVKSYSESHKYIHICFSDNKEPIPFPYPESLSDGTLSSMPDPGLVKPPVSADTNRITSIRIDWFNNGLSCAEDENNWQLTVYRNRGTQSYITKDGRNKILREEKYGLHDFQREQIFSLLEEIDDTGIWADDFSVQVCDGFSYSIRLTYNDRHTRKVIGTVMFPPRWNELLALLRMMQEIPLDDARDTIEWIQNGDEIDVREGRYYIERICRNCGATADEGKYCMQCGASLRDARPQLINYENIPVVYGPPPEFSDVVCKQCGAQWSVNRPWRSNEIRKVYCPECGFYTEVTEFKSLW